MLNRAHGTTPSLCCKLKRMAFHYTLEKIAAREYLWCFRSATRNNLLEQPNEFGTDMKRMSMARIINALTIVLLVFACAVLAIAQVPRPSPELVINTLS